MGSGANHPVDVNEMVHVFFGKIHAVVWYIIHDMAGSGDCIPHGLVVRLYRTGVIYNIYLIQKIKYVLDKKNEKVKVCIDKRGIKKAPIEASVVLSP